MFVLTMILLLNTSKGFRDRAIVGSVQRLSYVALSATVAAF